MWGKIGVKWGISCPTSLGFSMHQVDQTRSLSPIT